MNTKQEAIILAERPADDGRLGSILREWGYRESEIQRFLSDSEVDQKPGQRPKTTDQSRTMPRSMSCQHCSAA